MISVQKSDILKKAIEAFKNIRIAVIGDLILDVYLWGEASRISQEAPVPVLKVNKRTERLGGAANVLCNISTLGAKALAYGVVGDDENANRLETLLDSYGIVREGILRDSSRITTEKQRVIASSQQLLRIDHEITEGLSERSKSMLLEKVKNGIENNDFDALLFEDYAKGVLDTETAEQITKLAQQAGIPVGIDPHPGHPIEISGITLMTPNRSEAFGLAGIYQNKTDSEDELEQLNKVACRIQGKWKPDFLLITLGAKGMALFEKDKEPLLIPTQAREVFDVSGAGDTVIATFTLALMAGSTPAEAVDLANHAAGIVVGKVGTVSVTKEELLHSIKVSVN